MKSIARHVFCSASTAALFAANIPALCEARPGFRLNEGFPEDYQPIVDFAGPPPERTFVPSLAEIVDSRYRPTAVTNDLPQSRAVVHGGPKPVLPSDHAEKESGMASLRDILGKDEYLYVSSALYGICGGDGDVSFVRTNGTTALTFKTGFQCSIDDSSGEILSPPGLPGVTDAELADMTWDWMEESGELAKWSAAYQETNENGTLVERLSEVRLDDIFRVSDKAFVAWRLVRVPASPDGSHSRLVFWIDLPSGKIIAHHAEISEWLPIRSFRQQTDETSEQQRFQIAD